MSMGRDETGSSLVAATSLVMLLAIIGLALTARVTSGVVATAGALDRERALSAAEAMLALTLDRFATHPEAQRYLAGETAPTAMDLPWQVLDPAVPSTRSPVEVSRTVTRRSPGEVLIEVSGRSAGEERRLDVLARRRSVVDHVWMTDIEVLDPVLTATPRGLCHVHGGGALLPEDLDCRTLGYGAGDRFEGPFHSNDMVRIDGPVTFLSSATTAWVTSSDRGVTAPAFTGPGISASPGPFGLGAHATIRLPMVAQVHHEDGPTCRFRGPTIIRLVGTSIRVRSPLSVRGGDVDSGPLGCPGIDVAGLDGFVAIPLGESATIEVVRGRSEDCAVHPLGLTEDDDRDLERVCFAGDAFVWGRYSQRRAVVAHDDLVIVRDVVRDGEVGAAALLALVAGDSVILRRPVGATLRVVAPFGTNLPFGGSGTPPFGAWPLDAPLEHSAVWDAPLIEASLVALRGSVRIENPAWGQEHVGPVTIRGSIAQRFRGALRWERRTSSGALQGRMGYDLILLYERALLERVPPGLPDLGDPSLRILDLQEVVPGVR